MNSGTTQTIGAYRILRPLGHGGMGSVYEAEHQDTAVRVALKTVRVARESLLPKIRREIGALARLDHPGLVRILDRGDDAGVPWYAMELVSGSTLRKWAELLSGEEPTMPDAATISAPNLIAGATQATLGGGPAPRVGPLGSLVHRESAERPAEPVQGRRLQEVLDLLLQLCGSLAYLHGEGLVHRDLKPENILVRADGRPVIVDFGLVTDSGARFSRESLVVETGAAGTLRYMAPEQLRGEMVDARADLYALGCILSELLTGQPPFVASTTDEMIRAHLFRPPPTPSQRVPGLPAALDELALGLLAKEPRERLGHASDVASTLIECGAQQDKDRTAPPPRAYLYRPGFAGRTEALREIETRLSRLESEGVGGVLFIGGESGVGKTRLLVEAGRRAGERGARVLDGECLPTGGRDDAEPGGTPLQALKRPLQAIADRCRERGHEETERLLGRRGRVLAAYEPSLLSLPGQDAQAVPTELAADAARHRLYVYLSETFGALAGAVTATTEASAGTNGRLLLILDDLQWADSLTIGFVEFVLKSERPVPFVIAVSYRTEEIGSALRGLLDIADHIELGRLEEPAVGAIVGDMLAIVPPPTELVRFLSRQSEGNPFFVAEYLRTAVAEGLLYRNPSGRWVVESEEAATGPDYESLPLPRALLDLVRRRLSSLGSAPLRLAEIAAVLGRECDPRVLEAVVDMDRGSRQAPELDGLDTDAQRLKAIDELLARQVLEEVGSADLRFVHDKLREVAYSQLDDARRQTLHRWAAEAIEQRFGTQRHEHLAAVGVHWERGARPQLAARYLVEAGDRAASAYAAQDGLAALDRAIAILDDQSGDPRALPDLLRGLAARCRVLDQLGRYAEAEETARRLSELAGTTGERRFLGKALRHWARALDNTGNYELALLRYQQALAVLGLDGDPQEICEIRSFIGWIHATRGEYDAAESELREALSVDGLAQHSAARWNALVMRGLTLYRKGDLRESLRIFDELLSAGKMDDPILRARCEAAAIPVHRDLGNPERALQLLRGARETFRRFQVVQDELLHGANLAVLLADRGAFAEAVKVAADIRRLAELHGEAFVESFATQLLSTCELPRGRIATATALAAGAADAFQRLGDRRWCCIALGLEGAARAAGGDEQAADECFARRLGLARLLSPAMVQRCCAAWAWECLEREGAAEQARNLAEQARAALPEPQDRIHLLRAELVLALLGAAQPDDSAAGTALEVAREILVKLEEARCDPRTLQRAALSLAEAACARQELRLASDILGTYRRHAHHENLLHELRAAALEARIVASSGRGGQAETLFAMAAARVDSALAGMNEADQAALRKSPLLRLIQRTSPRLPMSVDKSPS